jgi:hypothetical protein
MGKIDERTWTCPPARQRPEHWDAAISTDHESASGTEHIQLHARIGAGIAPPQPDEGLLHRYEHDHSVGRPIDLLAIAPYTPAVNWSAALPTLLGTIVGASLTLLADRVRWRRDEHQRGHAARRDAYAAYLAALHATSERIRTVSHGEHLPEASTPSAAREAFSSANLNATREQIMLVAPAPIVRAADDAFRRLRTLRNLLSQGHDSESPDYKQALYRYQLALKTLRNVMRGDLGTSPLDE